MSDSASQGHLSRRDTIILCGIVAAFVGLGIAYSLITPIFESPDEVWHFAYVREIATRHGIPTVRTDLTQPWAQEGTQSPLYYLLGAPLIAWINPSDLEKTPEPNPFAQIGIPRAATNDNRNAFLHASQESFPFGGAALAVHLLRWFSVVLGALTILFTFALARQVFPSQPTIALAAAAFVAFLPQFLSVGTAVSNDGIATTLAAATLWQMARTIRLGMSNQRAIALGILVSGATLAKMSNALLAPLVLIAFVVIALAREDWRKLVRPAIIFLAIIALLTGWWFIRNLQLYGEPTGISMMAQIMGERGVDISIWRWLVAESESVRLSLWGVFGWMNILAAPEFYWFFDALALVGIIGILVALARRIVTARTCARFLASLEMTSTTILALWCIAVFIALVRFSLITPASQGRLLFPALPAYAVLWAWGVASLVAVRFQSWVTTTIAGAQFIVAAIAPIAFIAPAYTPTILNGALPSGANQIDYKFENGFELIGVASDRTTVHPSESLDVTLTYKIPLANNRRIATFIHIVNSADVIISQRDSFIGAGNPNALPASGIAADTYRIAIPITANAPDDYRVIAGIYDPTTNTRFKTLTPSASDSITLATLRAEPSNQPWNFDFDGRATLTRVELSANQIARRDTLIVKINWSDAPESHRIFLHTLGDDESIWASADAPIEREMRLELKFDPRTPAGIYRLELGVYPNNGDRVAVYDARHQFIGDRLFLNPIRVVDR